MTIASIEDLHANRVSRKFIFNGIVGIVQGMHLLPFLCYLNQQAPSSQQLKLLLDIQLQAQVLYLQTETMVCIESAVSKFSVAQSTLLKQGGCTG